MKIFGHHVESNEAKRYQEPIRINGWSRKVWNEVDQDKIDNAIDSMSSWIRNWLKQNRERINY